MAKAKKPEYVTIKRVVETEESYTVRNFDPSPSGLDLAEGLRNGDLNMVQSETVEPYVWVVNKFGRRVAVLEKDGGCGPDHKVEVEVK